MQLKIVVAAALLGTAASAQTMPRPIFREVRLVADTIRLGRAWPGASRLGIAADDSVAALPKGAFGWAEGIEIHRDRSGVVRQIDFSYGVQRDVAALLRDYRESLGQPIDSSRTTEAGRKNEKWVWRDEKTEFALVRFLPARNGVQARSTLADRSHR
jgi:hypothetical protein